MKVILAAVTAASLVTCIATAAIAQDKTVIHKESADGEYSKTVVKRDDGSKTVIKRHGPAGEEGSHRAQWRQDRDQEDRRLADAGAAGRHAGGVSVGYCPDNRRDICHDRRRRRLRSGGS